MADTKISALPAVVTPTSADELAVNQAGTSKKLTLAQVKTSVITPTVPIVVAVTAEFTGTGVPTATLPTGHTTNDILVLVIQSSNEIITPPAGYARIGPQNGIGTAVAAGATRLGIFWKRDGGSESAPTIPDTGDHTYGFMFAVRGCPTVGDPFVFGGNNFKFTTSTAGVGPVSVTHLDNLLVVDIFAGSADNASAEGTSLANTDLSNVTEWFDDGTTDGTGGFLFMMSGTRANAGEVKATTVTWANTSVDLCSRIHFIPVDSLDDLVAARGVEVQIFIGSPQDTDDTWVKPTGARKVFVQLCDGGGSGSSGHTVTTAAGGGGGGGGGYDEALFNAFDLAATITVHAGKGGAATSAAVDQAGNAGVVSEFNKGTTGPLTAAVRLAGVAATAAASADGGNGGCGSGRALTALAVNTTRADLYAVPAAASIPSYGGGGGRGGSGTTAPVGGSPAEWGGGGGESGGDTDGATTNPNNGYSLRGGGGGAGGRTVQAAGSPGPQGGGAAAKTYAVGANGNDSTSLPFGGSGACGGDSTTAPGGAGGFPGGGGGGGGGNNAATQGGRGGHGCIVVTTFF